MDIHAIISSFKPLDWRSPLHEYPLLYSLVAWFRPKKIFELGAARGLSAIVMAAALRDWSIDGHVWTSEIRPDFCKIASETIKHYQMEQWITLLCGDGRKEAPKYAPYDLAFIDGNHDYNSVKADFTVLKELARHLLFHDSQWIATPDVKKFVDECRVLKEFDIINLQSANYDIALRGGGCGMAIFMRI